MLLKFENLEVSDLVDLGSWADKQDPCLTLTCMGKSFTTERQQDAGTSASFPETYTVDIGDALDVELEVEASNKSLFGKLTHLGVGKTSLKDIISQANSQKVYTIELDHNGKKKKHQGKVKLLVISVGEPAKAPLDSTPPSIKPEPVPEVKPKSLPPNEKKKQSEPVVQEAILEDIKKSQEKPAKEVEISAKPTDKIPDQELKNPVDKAPENVPKVEQVEEFSAGTLYVTKITCSKLKNVEMLGKNDVYVKMKLKDWNESTEVLEDHGSEALFENLNFAVDVTAGTLQFEQMEVEVWDQNSIRSDQIIGKANVPLLMAFIQAGTSVDIPVELTDKKGKSSGEVMFTVCAKPLKAPKKDVGNVPDKKLKSNEPKPVLSENTKITPFTNGTLRIKTILCRNLKNVELMGKNDPYIVLELGAWTDKTDVKENEGSNVEFDFLNFSTEVTADILQYEQMNIQVWDKNHITSDKLIGTSKVPLLMAFIQAGQYIDIETEIVDAKNKPSGSVVLSVCAIPSIEKGAEINSKLASAKESYLRIHRIRASKLTGDNGFLGMNAGKCDPYVKLSLTNSGWKATTPTICDVRETALFEHVDAEMMIKPADLYKTESIQCSVYDANNLADRLIGMGSVNILAVALAEIDEEVELTCIINDEKGKVSGELTMYASTCLTSMSVPESIETFEIPSEYDTGFFRVKSITTHDLKNTEYFGKQDPYVTLEFGPNWKVRTSTLDNQVSECHWEGLDFKCVNVTKEMLKDSLIVHVMNDNGMMSAGVIGMGKLSLLKAVANMGKDVDVELKLSTEKGKPAGRIILNIEFTAGSDNVIDPLFASGSLCISKIVSHGIQGNSLLGGELSSFVELSIPALNWTGKTLTSVGDEETVWNRVDIQIDGLTMDLLKSTAALDITLCEEGALRKRVVCGTSSISLSKACPVLSEETQLDCILKNEKNKEIGRLSLFTVMKSEEQIFKEKNAELLGRRKVEEEENAVLAELGKTGGLFIISSVKGYDLKNTELMGDKQDPYFIVSYGSEWSETSHALPDSGSDVLWKDLEIELEIPNSKSGGDDILRKTALQFVCMDKNNVNSDSFIGQGEIKNLIRFVHQLDTEIEVTVNLIDKNNISAGKLIVIGEMRKFSESLDESASKALTEIQKSRKFPEDVSEFSLHICRARCFELKNTEIVGKADPYVKIKCKDWEDKTNALDNQGSDVVWDYLDMRIPNITLSDLNTIVRKRKKTSLIDVELWDSNTILSDKMIGKACIPSILMMTELDKEYEFNLDLLDEKSRIAGRCSLFIKLTLPPVPTSAESIHIDPKDIVFDKKFSGVGSLFIKKIAAFKLRKVETITKQDPYVKLSIRNIDKASADKCISDGTNPNIPVSIWDDQTEVKDNGGTDCSWDYLDFKTCEMSADLLKKNYIFDVFVYDHNDVRSDVLIGFGSVSYHSVLKAVDTQVELSVNLKADVGSKNSPKVIDAGRVTLFVELKNKEGEWKLKPGFQFGNLQIFRMRALNLKNTEIFGKQDPFVEVSLGGDMWKDKTFTVDNGGANCLWDFLTMQTEVLADTIVGTPLELVVYDQNNTRSNALIGKGSTSLLKCGAKVGEEVELTVELTDDKGESTGKILVFAKLTEVSQLEAKVPDDFVEGTLQLKRITGSNLKFSEMFDTCDPYVKLKLNEIEQKTIVLDNGGNDPSWNFLDIKFPVDKKTLRGKELAIEFWDENSMTSDKKIGTCNMPIRKAGGKIGEDVEIVMDLLNEDNKPVGKVAIVMQVLKETAALKQLTKTGGPKPKAKIVLPDGFEVGMIEITEIQAFGLQNKELVGESDPYVKLTYDHECMRTDTLDNAGSNVVWRGLEMDYDVHKDTLLADERLFVEVLDENTTRGDVSLGKGSVSLRKCCASFNNSMKLSVDLVNNEGGMCGRVTLICALRKASLDEVVDAIPDSAITLEQGTFTVKRIELKNLKGAESILGNKDPFVKFYIENICSMETKPINNAGSYAIWDKIEDMKCSVTGDVLRFKPIKIEVYDKNVVSAHELLGTGECSLRKVGSHPGKDTEIHIVVKDKKGKRKGNLIITAVADPIVVPVAGGNDVGILKISTIKLKDIKNTAMIGTQNVFVELKMGSLFKQITPIAKNVDKNVTIESLRIQASIATSQISTGKLHATIYSKATVGKNSLVGEADISLLELLNSKGSNGGWTVVSGDVVSKNKKSGQIFITGHYDGNGEDNDDWPMPEGGDQNTPTPDHNSEDLELLKNTCDSIKSQQGKIDSRLSALQASIKQDMLKDLAKERQKMENMLSSQTSDIKATLEQAMKMQLQKLHEQEPKAAAAPPPPVVQNISKITLPRKISTWRTVHVQAWLGIQLELPQYIDIFAEASVDGLVLLHHVTDDMLIKHLNVKLPLHRVKILEAIRELQAKQHIIDLEVEHKREELLKQRQMAIAAREAAERKLKAKNKLKKKELKPKKKKKKKVVSAPMKLREVTEQHGVERVKLERDMKLLHKQQAIANAKTHKANKIWQFEYTGASSTSNKTISDLPGTSSNLWSNMADDEKDKAEDLKKHGSLAYQMTLSNLLQSNSNAMYNDSGESVFQQTRGRSTKVKTIPKNCSLDEVITILKGAMFEVSTWFVEVQKMSKRREHTLNSDVEQMGTNVDLYVDTDYDTDANGEYSDDESLPPGYDSGTSDSEEIPAPAYEDGATSTTSTSGPPGYDSEAELQSSSVHSKSKSLVIVSPPLDAQAPNFDEEMDYVEPQFDRVKLVYEAFVNQESNGAKWLGSNNKLTRLKLSGGIESILRLELSWGQFDMLWTMLDHQRSGEIDYNEFRDCFGDVGNFESSGGAGGLSLTGAASKHSSLSPSARPSKDISLVELTKCLYQLSDTMRYAGFTVIDMFASFDRNGSGDVSISEFCSMLRVIIGNNFNKKQIYRALLVIDTDGNKSISLDELLKFIYNVWRTQIDEIGVKLQKMAIQTSNIAQNTVSFDNTDDGMDRKLQQKLLRERNDIKDAIKKNFTRDMRDQLERNMVRDEYGRCVIDGPFSSVMQRLGVNTNTMARNTGNGRGSPLRSQSPTFEHSPTATNTSFNASLSGGNHSGRSRSQSPSRSSSKSPGRSRGLTNSTSGKRNLATAGSNELLRYKLKNQTITLPSRVGTKLRIPAVCDMNKNDFVSPEAIASTLRAHQAHI